MSVTISDSIFRAYDIRGIVGDTLTVDVVYAIGLAIGSEVLSRGEKAIALGRDGRLSGPQLSQALANGCLASGCDVINLGMVTTPVLYFATHFLKTTSGVMLTGSHNPPKYNGIKIVLGGEALYGEGISALYQRIVQKKFMQGEGQLTTTNILDAYIDRVAGDVKLTKPIKAVVDCGNGVAGVVAPQLLKKMGVDVVELYCKVDGNFPNHHPDPSIPENLQELIAKVKQTNADVGLAFDGDADRLGVVTNKGEIIFPDRQLMLFAKDVLSRNPAAEIIYDVKCSRHVKKVIEHYGGKSLMWKTGHSLVKAKMRETGALLGGEMSGHLFFKERWYGFDDGVYTAVRLLEILSNTSKTISELFTEIPDSVNTPELKLPIEEEHKFEFMEQFIQKAKFAEGEICTLDGLRVDFADGWGLIRPSNTTPCLVLRFEADDSKGLTRIKKLFREQLLKFDPSLNLPF